jgi:hypothetical protein
MTGSAGMALRDGLYSVCDRSGSEAVGPTRVAPTTPTQSRKRVQCWLNPRALERPFDKEGVAKRHASSPRLPHPRAGLPARTAKGLRPNSGSSGGADP